MECLHKNDQLMLKFIKTLLLVLYFSYHALMTFLMMLPVICYADDTTLYCKCDLVPHLWQQLELAARLESDLRDTQLRQKVAF